jgi:DNA-binding transcriptional ArsR family regulator
VVTTGESHKPLSDGVVCATLANEIARFQSGDGLAWPSQVQFLFASRRQLSAQLRRLERQGLVRIERSRSGVRYGLTHEGYLRAWDVLPLCRSCRAPIQRGLRHGRGDLCRRCLIDLLRDRLAEAEHEAEWAGRRAEAAMERVADLRARIEALAP